MSESDPLRVAAKRYVAAGLSVIPINPQSKRPWEKLLPLDPDIGHGSWKVYQTRPASWDEVTLWLGSSAQLALVCGSVSGGVLLLDLETQAVYIAWRSLVGSLADNLVIQQTGGGGVHVLMRCPDPGRNDKLAWRPDAQERSGRKILIETRAEGGYAVVAPSLHPSGNRYVMLQGDLAAIPVVDQVVADALVLACRKLDEAPWTKQQQALMDQAMQIVPDQPKESIIAAYNAQVRIEDALRAAGYHPAYGGRWARPGGHDASVVLQHGKSFHHASNDPLNDGHWHDAFDLFAFAEHGGDYKAAAVAARGLLGIAAPLPSVGAPSTNGHGPSPPANSNALSILTDAPLTDTGNAECFSALFGTLVRYDHNREMWLCWDSQRWKLDSIGLTQQYCLSTVRQRYAAATTIQDLDRRKKLAVWAINSEAMAKRKALLEAAQYLASLSTQVDQYDADPFLAATLNGTLDLRTGTVRAPAQTDYLTMQLPVAVDPSATCPRWDVFIQQVFAGDVDLIAYIQRAVGYSLTADARERKLFLCHGGGTNGKSVFLEVLTALMGDFAANASFDTFDAGRRNEQTNDLAALKGKRFLTMIETDQDRRLAEAKVKSVTGRDRITCRFLHKEFFTYLPQFKIWLAMNHKPVITGTDKGIWSRIALIPFTQDFTAVDNKLLGDELKTELPGILNWTLEGLKAWHQHGLGTAVAVTQATAAYRQESDEMGTWLSEALIADPNEVVPALAAYSEYRDWMLARGNRFPVTQTSWSRSMTDRGYVTRRQSIGGGKKQMVYVDLRFRTVGDP